MRQSTQLFAMFKSVLSLSLALLLSTRRLLGSRGTVTSRLRLLGLSLGLGGLGSCPLGLLLLGVRLQKVSSLLLLPLFAAATGFLDLKSSRIGDIGHLLVTDLLGLLLVNVFHQDTLVLEHVTLGLQVEFVVQMVIDLLVGAILLQ